MPGECLPPAYAARKARLQCTRCSAPAAEDSTLCEKHRQGHAASEKKRAGDRRRGRRKRGLCAFCELESVTYRCPDCTAAKKLHARP